MPKRGLAALAITTVALILLISFKTPDDVSLDRTTGNVAVVEDVGGSAGSTAPATSPPTTNGPATKATPEPTDSSGGGASTAATTVDGPVVSTRFGPVQVEVVIADGKMSDVVALQLPSGRRSGQISQYSEPILREEALQAQDANIDVVSGATYTSDAYAQSLQAALDEAGIG